MRSRQPMKLTFLFQLHNVALSSGSLLLLLLMVEEILPIIRDRGLFYSICGPEAWTSVGVFENGLCGLDLLVIRNSNFTI